MIPINKIGLIIINEVHYYYTDQKNNYQGQIISDLFIIFDKIVHST